MNTDLRSECCNAHLIQDDTGDLICSVCGLIYDDSDFPDIIKQDGDE